ncbi:thiol-disulfide oxidoreductase DCC family protein [Bordetella sp. LUAb4]|uniref:thiol-disulfide oxidoreductase DCC family protein n=1 Tax=Bordetella sp. LUAb4 TaxID=2843195 RepID=UPI001E4932ED|nr:DCC1-like thiol-disulfide oxidoreductase family protein [Bordetella sp. LUAb4]
MPEISKSPYSYRQDSAVPEYDDRKPLFVFDGICVLCSGGASWLMKYDRRARVNFAPAQEVLGQTLYAHYDLIMDESYLLIANGRAYTATRGYVELFKILGGPWHLLRAFAIVPECLRDRIYALIARNRYRWFGKTEYCTLLTKDQRSRLL